MLKRLSLVILSAGLFLGLTPVAASAHGGGGNRDDDHYRCMYRCRGEYYYRQGDHDRDARYCWYKDRYGWYRARCYKHPHRDDYGGGYYRGQSAAEATPVTPYHAGHDHGDKADKPKPEPKPKPKKPKDEKPKDETSHDDDGYDAHRSHDSDG